MPAHHAEPAQTAGAVIPVAGLLLAVLMIVTVCLLAVAAAGSSIPPSGSAPAVSGPTLTPDDPAAATPVPVQELER